MLRPYRNSSGSRADGSPDYYNRRWQEYTGCSIEDILARGWEAFVHSDDLGQARALWAQAIASSQLYEAQYRLQRSDGAARWFLARALPLRDEQGAITEWFGTCTDIHDQKEAERTQQFLVLLSERMRHAPDPDSLLWEVVTALGEYLQATRYTFAEVDAERNRITVHRDYCRGVPSTAGTYSRADFGNAVTQDLRAGRTVTLSDTHYDSRSKDRAAQTYDPLGIRASVNVPIGNGGVQVATLSVHMAVPRAWTAAEIALVETVAERTGLAVENARLLRSEREQDVRNTAILNSITDAFFALDAQWRFTYLNDQAERLLLRTREELLGKKIWAEFPAAVGTAFHREYHHAFADQATVSFEEYYPPLDTWFEVRAYPAPEGLAVYFQNINARRQSAEALRRSEEKYRTLFETMTQGVVYQDADGVIVSANPAAERLLGLTLDQMQGRTSIDPRWKALYEDGSPMPGVDHPPMRALTTGRPVRDVIQGIYNPVREETRWLLVNSVPQYYDGDDRPYQVYSVFDDVTERRAAQEETRHSLVRQRVFLRDVLASVTDGKLILCDTAADLPLRRTPFGDQHALSKRGGLRELRRDAAAAAGAIGFPDIKATDLVTAVGEAGMNAVVHVGEGLGQVFVDHDRAVVQVFIRDQGPGITLENLPKATLRKGFTTAGTMGHGMKMMLQTADLIYLLTGTGGTTVVLEQHQHLAEGVTLSGMIPSMITVVVSGARGRMGRETVRAVSDAPDVDLTGEVGRGDDLAAILTAAKPDALVDFTLPEAALPNIRTALRHGVVPIVGTTGIGAEGRAEIAALCRTTGIGALIAPSFALGAVLMMQFARQAAAYFPDAEIVELHHEKKIDAPSGTALTTAELIAEGRADAAPIPLPADAFEKIPGARGGAGAGGVPIHSVRLPGLVASQMVIFGGPGQTLTIRHDTIDRTSFMPGVLLALRRVPDFGARGELVYGLEHLL